MPGTASLAAAVLFLFPIFFFFDATCMLARNVEIRTLFFVRHSARPHQEMLIFVRRACSQENEGGTSYIIIMIYVCTRGACRNRISHFSEYMTCFMRSAASLPDLIILGYPSNLQTNWQFPFDY